LKSNTVTPYKNRLSKKEQVAGMFNHIAPRYDFLNHFLSLGIDRVWRRKVVKKLKQNPPERMLDVACGTGDLAIATAKRIPDIKIDAVDIAAVMLERARVKIDRRNLGFNVHLNIGDAEDLQFPDGRFNAVTSAFGVRNFEDLEKGLSEMYRVLKKDGSIIILEFSQPRKGLFAMLFKLYFNAILPFIGRVFSGNNRAYAYLPESVNAFPERENFVKLLEQSGFKNSYYKTFTFGVACMYYGKK